MVTLDYLELIEKKYTPKNDSQLADLLKVRPTTIYRYKKDNRTMDDDVCFRVAQLLGIPVEPILIDMKIQSSLSDKSKKAWMKISKSIAASALLGMVLINHTIIAGGNCILCKIKEILIYQTNHRIKPLIC